MGSVMKQDSSGAEQGGSSNSEQRPQPGQYDGRPMGPPPYGYSQQGPPPHFQHQHFRGPPPCAQGGRPSLSYQLYPPHLQGGSLQFFRPL